MHGYWQALTVLAGPRTSDPRHIRSSCFHDRVITQPTLALLALPAKEAKIELDKPRDDIETNPPKAFGRSFFPGILACIGELPAYPKSMMKDLFSAWTFGNIIHKLRGRRLLWQQDNHIGGLATENLAYIQTMLDHVETTVVTSRYSRQLLTGPADLSGHGVS
ncbi:hypothetical protein OG21DRAFT_585422 [Imleria badia]|nr:hypothetical protein OG21DRAFT_585422 [Imleria badia]